MHPQARANKSQQSSLLNYQGMCARYNGAPPLDQVRHHTAQRPPSRARSDCDSGCPTGNVLCLILKPCQPPWQQIIDQLTWLQIGRLHYDILENQDPFWIQIGDPSWRGKTFENRNIITFQVFWTGLISSLDIFSRVDTHYLCIPVLTVSWRFANLQDTVGFGPKTGLEKLVVEQDFESPRKPPKMKNWEIVTSNQNSHIWREVVLLRFDVDSVNVKWCNYQFFITPPNFAILASIATVSLRIFSALTTCRWSCVPSILVLLLHPLSSSFESSSPLSLAAGPAVGFPSPCALLWHSTTMVACLFKSGLCH